MSYGLSVGVGRKIITPTVGTILFGYAPGRPAESVNDDLRVTCIALQQGETKAMLISADICLYDAPHCDRLRGLIETGTGVPADNVIFCSTHTHSGPAASAGAGWGTTNEAYNEQILDPRTVEAAAAACAGLRPALLGIGTTESNVGINRRELSRDGTVSLGQNPWGPYDPAMTVLCFRTTDGTPIVNAIHYCCHGTAAGKNPEITRDWSGPMVDCLEEQSGAISVFFNGAEGDVGPRLPNGKTTGSLKLALDLGALAGIDAVRAWRGIKTFRDVPLRVLTREIALPFKTLTDRETATRALHDLGDPERLVGMDAKAYDKWRQVIDTYASGDPRKTHRRFKESAVFLGSAAFVPLPFEMFVEITLRIRLHSPFEHTLCLSNSNGQFGYFPARDQYCRGGYEITSARNYDAYELAENADDSAVDQIVNMLES